jgi:hypothetical protein
LNAAQLHTGELYAWKKNPPKGRIPIDATKVRLRHIEQRKRSYMQNRQTYAAITVVETGNEYDVPAREIIMFWDEYEGEQYELLKAQREQKIRNRRATLRNTVTESMITYRLNERQIPVVPSSTYGGSVSFSLQSFLTWLGISDADIQRAIDDIIASEFPDDEEEE